MYDLGDLAVELNGISANLTMFRFQFEDGAAKLSDSCAGDALFALSNALDRIAEELFSIEEQQMKKAPEGTNSRVYRYGKGTALSTSDASGDTVSQIGE